MANTTTSVHIMDAHPSLRGDRVPARAETLASIAYARAQRRFRVMVGERTYGDPTARATRLYVEAERLLDNLRAEVQAADPGAPDYLARWTEGEYRFGWGK